MSASSATEPRPSGPPATVHTAEAETPSDIPDSRTWQRALGDLTQGARARELWSHLGWTDIKQRYRRSVLEPLWITLGTAVMVIGLGFLTSGLFGQALEYHLPYLATGFIIWSFLLGCVNEGAQTFIYNEETMKHLPAPLTVQVLRTVWRLVLMLAHNMIIYVVMVAIFFSYLNPPYRLSEDKPSSRLMPGISADALLAAPGLTLVVLNAVWVVMLFGILSTRFRDIPPVVESIMQLAFYVSPIVWSTDTLGDSAGGLTTVLVQLNPFYHFINIVRAPLIGQTIEWQNWAVVLGFAVIGWTATLYALRNYRARVTYWV